MDVLMDGIVFGESPRWREGKVWVSDWGTGRVHSVSADGASTIEAEIASFPLCIDFLPDGRLLLVSSAGRTLLRRELDGGLVPHADLAPVATTPWNDIVVDDAGNAYVNNIGFDFPEAEFAPGIVVLVEPDGTVTPVANGQCVPVGEGGEVLTRVEFDRGAFACVLSRDADPKLYVVGQDWQGPDGVGGATGRLASFPAPAPGDGRP
jgi:sugar lactone lactonase YvrE